MPFSTTSWRLVLRRAGGLVLSMIRGLYFPDEVTMYTDVLLRVLFALYYLPMISLVLAATHSALERIVWTLVIPVTQEMERAPMSTSHLVTLTLGLWTISLRMLPFVTLGISVATVGHKTLNCFGEAMVDACTVHDGMDYPLLGARLRFVLEKRSRAVVYYVVLTAFVILVVMGFHTNILVHWSLRDREVVFAAWLVIMLQGGFVVYTLVTYESTHARGSPSKPWHFFSRDMRYRLFALRVTSRWWQEYVHHMRHIAMELVLVLSAVFLVLHGPVRLLAFTVELLIYLNFPHLFCYSVLSVSSATIRTTQSLSWLLRHSDAAPAVLIIMMPYQAMLLHACYYFGHHWATVCLFVLLMTLLLARAIDLVREFDVTPHGSVLWKRVDTGAALPPYIAVVLEDTYERHYRYPNIVSLDLLIDIHSMKMHLRDVGDVDLERTLLHHPAAAAAAAGASGKDVQPDHDLATRPATARPRPEGGRVGQAGAATGPARPEVGSEPVSPKAGPATGGNAIPSAADAIAPAATGCTESASPVFERQRGVWRTYHSGKIGTYFRDARFYTYATPRMLSLQSAGYFAGERFRNTRIFLRVVTLSLLAIFAVIVTGVILQAAFPRLRPWPVRAFSTDAFDTVTIDHIVIKMRMLSTAARASPLEEPAAPALKATGGRSSDVKWGTMSGPEEDWYPSLCPREFHGVSVFEMSLLAVAPYLFNKDEVGVMLEFMRRHMNATWEIREQHGSDCVTTSSANTPTGWRDYFDFYNAEKDVVVMAVRGTDLMSLTDMLMDINLFFEAALHLVLSSVVPGAVVLPSGLVADLIHVASLPQDTDAHPVETWHRLTSSRNHSLRECQRNNYHRMFYADLQNHIAYLGSRPDPPSNILLVGHSLGGAVANIVGARLGIQSVAFNSPGVALSRKKFDVDLQAIHRHTVSIISSHDIVSLIGGQAGELHNVECLLTPRELCHAIEFLIGTLWRSCGSIRKRYPSIREVV